MKKILYLFFLLIVGTTIINGCGTSKVTEEDITIDVESEPFECTIMGGGSQDCELLKIEDKVMMIDTGLKENSNNVIKLLEDKNINKIDYLILTHMDKDHIGGAYEVLNKVDVGEVIQADYIKESSEYSEYEKILKEKNIEPTKIKENINLVMGKANITVYSPEKADYKQSNDYSIMVCIDYINESFLFAGDAEKSRLKEYLNSEFNKEYTFLKVPHHGRLEKNSEEFLKAVNPKFAVITCSAQEPADEEVLSILKELGTETYLNINGTITVESDGESITIIQ